MPVALPTNEEQWLYTPLELLHTPSIRSGWSPSLEGNTRALAVHRLMCLKDVFQTPQIVVNTAATYLHRFYMRESFHQYAWETLASSSFFLASKVEENQRRLKDVVSVSLDLTAGKQPHPPDRAHPVNEARDGFRGLRQKVLYYEEVLLRTLCFDLTVRQPYADMLLAVGKIWPGMDKDGIRRIKAVAHSVITDSLSTTTLLIHRANVIAAASIVIACAQLEIPLPGPPGSNAAAAAPAPEEGEEKEEGQYWVEVFDVKPADVLDAIWRMMAMYEVALDDFVRDEARRTTNDALGSVLDRMERKEIGAFITTSDYGSGPPTSFFRHGLEPEPYPERRGVVVEVKPDDVPTRDAPPTSSSSDPPPPTSNLLLKPSTSTTTSSSLSATLNPSPLKVEVPTPTSAEQEQDVPMPDAPPSPTSSNAPIPTPFAFPSPQPPPPPPPPPSLPTSLETGLAPPPDSEDSDMAISPGAS